MHFATLPDTRAAGDRQGPAIADGTQSLTNDQLLHHVRGVTRHLKDLGIRHGDVVALKLTNRVEFVTPLFAAWRLGATITPINPILTFAEVARQLDDSHARLLVVEDADIADVADHAVTTISVSELSPDLGWEDFPPEPDSSDLALIIYTSGTTGVPKGVMLDHANLATMAEMGRQALQVGPEDRSLLILPLATLPARPLSPPSCREGFCEFGGAPLVVGLGFAAESVRACSDEALCREFCRETSQHKAIPASTGRTSQPL